MWAADSCGPPGIAAALRATIAPGGGYRISTGRPYPGSCRQNGALTRGEPMPADNRLWMIAPLRPIGTLVAALCLCLAVTADPAESAQRDIAGICDTVALDAAQQTGVPPHVLRAISLTETGRRQQGGFRPWPWTVNMEGAGHWFDTADDARAFVFREFKRGARSFDVGCFQINYKWHGDAFASLDQMFDPAANALYAARLLRSLYEETGSWPAAAGAYHSRTPELADRYKARFERILASLGGAGAADTAVPPPHGGGQGTIPEIPDIVLAQDTVAQNGMAQDGGPGNAEPRFNSYPLLVAGGTFGNGSLVPMGADMAAAAPLIGERHPQGVD